MHKGTNNKGKANILLASVFVIFAAATVFKYLFRSSFTAGLVAFTAEAALVGGIADWFAVTALFKKPLGFSWHTAIIPNSREQIVNSVSELVKNELLSTDAVSSKIASLNLNAMVIDSLLGSVDKVLLENKFQNLLDNKSDSFDSIKLASTIDNFIKEGLKKQAITNDLRLLLIDAFEEGKHKEWISSLLKKAIKIAQKDSTREQIFKLLKEQERYNESTTGAGSFFVKILINQSKKSKHSNLINIAELLQQELISVLKQLSNSSHPLFIKLTNNSASLFEHLDEDQTLSDLLQTWKNGILERLELLEAFSQLMASAVDSENRKQEAFTWLANNIDNYRARLKNDEKIRNSTEEMLKVILQKVIINEHHLIGEIAKETLDNFSNERLIRFIDDKVGNDLQWIRINGSVVGAAAGLIIYLFTHLLYMPYLLPLIQKLTGIG